MLEMVKDTEESNNCQHLPTNANNEEEQAEIALSEIVKALVKAGHNINTIKKIFDQYHYIERPASKGELAERVFKLATTDSGKTNLTDEIKDYIETTEGIFKLRDVCLNTSAGDTRKGRNKVSAILGRLLDEKIIAREGKMNGVFRRIDGDVDYIDFVNASSNAVNLWLPWELSDLTELNPGDCMIVAGEPNAGKTAVCFNIIRYNQNDFPISYFNSEMGPTEMKKRLQNFDIPLTAWNFEAIERSYNFADVIRPNNINIIDYLELSDEFYKVSGLISEIHRALDQGIAIICMQKNPGVDVALGGMRTLEKPRLALAVKPGAVKIVKAKNWKGTMNPNGLVRRWKLSAGCWFHSVDDWHPDPGGRKGGKI